MTVRMKRAIGFCLLAAAVTPGSTHEAEPPRVESGTIQTRQVSENLPRAVRSLAASTRGPAWAGYAAPEVAPRAGGGRSMCCFYDFKQYGTSGGRGTCRLEARGGFNIIAGPGVAGWRDAGGPGYFHVLFRIEDGEVVRIRPISAGCSVDVGRLDFFWLEGVTAGDS
ncbi:MAG TPA: hypothetical protein VFP98_00250, partial [Candidatus Polarisedimenticolia bacterium]|nr:hypothetical protein [Candidatus Polarisedimenticolia bacterium]